MRLARGLRGIVFHKHVFSFKTFDLLLCFASIIVIMTYGTYILKRHLAKRAIRTIQL